MLTHIFLIFFFTTHTYSASIPRRMPYLPNRADEIMLNHLAINGQWTFAYNPMIETNNSQNQNNKLINSTQATCTAGNKSIQILFINNKPIACYHLIDSSVGKVHDGMCYTCSY